MNGSGDRNSRKSLLTSALGLLLSLPTGAYGPLWGQQGPQEPRYGVSVEAVRVPVVVIDKEGNLYTELRRENFQLRENGRVQEITTFLGGAAPLTVLLVLENSQLIYYLRSEVLRPAGVLVSQILDPEDYAAIVAFDTRPRLVTDFTQNKQELMNAVNRLYREQTMMRESSLFDALDFALQGGSLEEGEYKGMSEVKGRTAVLLIATGSNTFSGLTFDEIRSIVANSGVPIYSIGVGERAYLQVEPYLGSLARMDYLQAQTRLQTFAKESGGRHYSVRFQGAINGILESITLMLRHQYTLGYVPAIPLEEDERRELELLVDIDGDGSPDNDRLDLQYRRYYGSVD